MTGRELNTTLIKSRRGLAGQEPVLFHQEENAEASTGLNKDGGAGRGGTVPVSWLVKVSDGCEGG